MEADRDNAVSSYDAVADELKIKISPPSLKGLVGGGWWVVNSGLWVMGGWWGGWCVVGVGCWVLSGEWWFVSGGW